MQIHFISIICENQRYPRYPRHPRSFETTSSFLFFQWNSHFIE